MERNRDKGESADEAPKDWQTLLRAAHEQIRADLGDRELPPIEDIIHEMREERDRQLMEFAWPGLWRGDESCSVRPILAPCGGDTVAPDEAEHS